MTTAEWGILIGGLGFLVTIITLIVRLTSTLTRVDVTMKNLNEKITDINCENQKQHDHLFGISDKHEETLNDHETRIQLIEKYPRRKATT